MGVRQGDAVRVDSEAARQTHAGTPEWMAPEVMQRIRASMQLRESGSDAAGGTESVDRLRCDLYSLGVVLWEIFARQPPLKDLPRMEVMKRVCEVETRASLEQAPTEGAPANYVECFKSCWQRVPGLRPTAQEVVDWVRGAERSIVQAKPRANRLVV